MSLVMLPQLLKPGHLLAAKNLLKTSFHSVARPSGGYLKSLNPVVSTSKSSQRNQITIWYNMSSMSMSTSTPGLEIVGQLEPGFDEILSDDALDFVAKLHRKFNKRRLVLLDKRVEMQKRIESGQQLKFLDSTSPIREKDWTIARLPADLEQRRVEITGPVDTKMVINALNSGADAYMADFEDSNTPTWHNQVSGQANMKGAVRRDLSFKTPEGKVYKLNEKIATLSVRPRGWHLSEKHVLVDGDRLSGSLFDFGLFFFHNAKEQIARGTGPYFYLPKLESHLEARLWNDVFEYSQNQLNISNGTIKATVLIETLPAAFEMEEILYELRDHSAGLNAGRWDYIFSCIKKIKHQKDFCLADRGLITMNVPFMRSYALHLIKCCHKRNAPAIGGMSALIPIKNDLSANEKALKGVRDDKSRDANDGFDGGWVAHPGLVKLAMDEFDRVLINKKNQIDKKRDDVNVNENDLLNFQPQKPITETGLRMNVNVGIRYLGSWLSGNGCVPIFNLMEDAATAEISRSQVWLWINSPLGILEDGRKITADLVQTVIKEEMKKIESESGSFSENYQKAAQIFEEMSTSPQLAEFLTLPLYDNL